MKLSTMSARQEQCKCKTCVALACGKSRPLATACDNDFPDCLKLHESLNHSLNEVMRWHGTTSALVSSIVREGFNERVCSLSGELGAGTLQRTHASEGIMQNQI